MRFSYLYLVFACAFVLSQGLHAQSHQNSKTSAHDLYFGLFIEDHDPMPAGGAFTGQFVENKIGRTLIVLTAEQKTHFQIPLDALAFANFRHDGHFYIAHIAGVKVDPTTGQPAGSEPIVDSVKVIQDHWEAKTNPQIAAEEAHAYLQIFFMKGLGIILDYDQATQQRQNQLPIDEVVFSIEALRSQEKPEAMFMPYAFSLDFAIGRLFYSKIDRDQQEAADSGRMDSIIPINFASVLSNIDRIARPEEAVLFHAIEQSHNFGRKQSYNFILNNCTNRLFDLLDESLKYRPGVDFDRNLFQRKVTEATTAEAPKFIAFVKPFITKFLASSKASNSEVDLKQLEQLVQMSEVELSNYFIEGAKKSSSPQAYDTWLPTFTPAHLAARHLLP